MKGQTKQKSLLQVVIVLELSWRTVKIKAMDPQIVKGHKSLLVLKVDIDKAYISVRKRW